MALLIRFFLLLGKPGEPFPFLRKGNHSTSTTNCYSLDISSQSIPAEPVLSSDIPFSPGETEAQRRLKAFVEGTFPPIFEYAEARQFLDIDGTPGLSPYLRFGMLSARQAVLAALQARQSAPNSQAQKGVET